MHGESQKSPFVVREMFFEAFGLKRRRLVEVRVAERTEESQISLAKLGVPGADFFERRVVRRVAGRDRIRTEEGSPFGSRIFAAG